MPTPGGPPVLSIPDSWSISSGLTWTNLGSGLGRFVDTSTSTNYYIYGSSDGTVGGVQWTFGTSVPSECQESLVTSTVGNVLQNGTVQRGAGTIAYGGHTYSVVQDWNGSQSTAILQ